MRRLSSPSVLFAICTLLLLLLALQLQFVGRTASSPAQYYIAYPARAMMAPFAVLSALLPFMRWAPLSYPFFAIIFALWPRITGRALDARLGRWQVALATLPLALGVFIDAIIIAFDRNVGAAQGEWPGSALSFLTFEATVGAVLACWAVSIVVFIVNVVRSIRMARGDRRAAL